MHSKLLKKFLSIFITITFLFSNITYAAPSNRSFFKNKKVDYDRLSTQAQDRIQEKKSIFQEEDPRAEGRKKEAKRVLEAHLKDISQIHIPAELGRVIEVYSAEPIAHSAKDKLIVHIQDLHTNPEGELNLARILELLLKDYNLGLVCSEGADGIVDTSSVSSFPDKEIREKTARLFINSGELTGEEYLSITKYPDLPIWGIEDKDIYFENIIQFNKIMKFNPSSRVFISQAKDALNALKPKVYSKDILAIDQNETDYEDQKIETDKYLEFLSSYIAKFNIPTDEYKNIAILITAQDMEKTTDQKKIMQESQDLLVSLQTAILKTASRSELDTLAAQAQLFKNQKISPFSFYSYLKDLALRRLPDGIAKYPNLNGFVDYLTKVNSLDTTKLFVEMESLTYEVKQLLAKKEEEKTLTKALRNIKFLEGFFNLKISNEELGYYLENKESHKVAFFEGFLKPALKKYNISAFIDFKSDLIDSHLKTLEDFYKTVKERDTAMLNNSLSEIEKRDVKVAALISGGFHTKGITKQLKDRGYSYIVISPYSSTDIDEENYHFLLSGKRKPITELLKKLDLTEVVNRLSSEILLRLSLAFNPGLREAFIEQVVPQLAQIWGVTEQELTPEDILNRIGPMLALGRNAERWQNPVVRIELRSPEEGLIIVKISPQEGNAGYIAITKDGVRKATSTEFKGTRLAKMGQLLGTVQLEERGDRGKGSPLELLKVLIELRDKGVTEVSRAQLIDEYRGRFSDETIRLEVKSLFLMGIISIGQKGVISLMKQYQGITLQDVDRMDQAARQIVDRGLDRHRLDDLEADRIFALMQAVYTAAIGTPADILSGITARLSSGDSSIASQALSELFSLSSSSIPNSIFTVGRVTQLHDMSEVRRDADDGIIVPLTDIVDTDGNVLIRGNQELLNALVNLGVIDRESHRLSGLVLTPMRDVSKNEHGGEEIHARSISSKGVNLYHRSAVRKGTGVSKLHPGGIPFDINIRSQNNYIDGGLAGPLIPSIVEKAQRLRANLEAIPGLREDLLSDLFEVPSVTIRPTYLIVKETASNSSVLREEGYKEVTQGAFLVPMDDMLYVIGENSELWQRAIQEMQFYGYTVAAPWRMGQLWAYVDYFKEKLGTDDTKEVFDIFVYRYAILIRLIHHEMDSIAGNAHVLRGSTLSTMFSTVDLGYCSFDYDVLRNREEAEAAGITEEQFEAIKSTEKHILRATIERLASDFFAYDETYSRDDVKRFVEEAWARLEDIYSQGLTSPAARNPQFAGRTSDGTDKDRGKGSPLELLRFMVQNSHYEGNPIRRADLAEARMFSLRTIDRETASLRKIGLLRITEDGYVLTQDLTLEQVEALYRQIPELNNYTLEDLAEPRISEIKTLVKFEGIEGIRREFNRRVEASAAEREKVYIVFERGRLGKLKFELEAPTDMDEDFLFEYLSMVIYNGLSVVGAERLRLGMPAGVFDRLKERFEILPEHGDVVKNADVPDRTYKLMNSYLAFVNKVPFTIEQATDSDIASADTAMPLSEPLGNIDAKKGTLLGIDLGRTTIKIAVIKDGDIVFTKLIPWTPTQITEARGHIDKIEAAIEGVIEETGITGVEQVAAIGISWSGKVADGRPAARIGTIDEGLSPEEFDKLADVAGELTDRLEVFSWVSNDGDSQGFGGTVHYGRKNSITFGMGGGLSFAYADANSNLPDILGEAGNLIIDMSSDASQHAFTGMPGASQAYLSQHGVVRLAEELGIDLSGVERDYDKAGEVGRLLEEGDPRAVLVFETMGRYLASGIIEASNYVTVENVFISGGVTTGKSGEIIKRSALDILRREHPEKLITIEVFTSLFGGAVGAAYLANFNRQKRLSTQVNLPNSPVNVDEAVAYLRSQDMQEEADALDRVFSWGRYFASRYSPYLRENKPNIRLVKEAPRACMVEGDLIIIDIDALSSEALLMLELRGAFRKIARLRDFSRSPPIRERSLQVFVSELEKIVSFWNFTNDVQMQYRAYLNDQRDTFITLLNDAPNERTLEELLDYIPQSDSYPDDVKRYLRRRYGGKPDLLIDDIVKFYSRGEKSVVENFNRQVSASGENKQVTFARFLACAAEKGYLLREIVVGVLDRQDVPKPTQPILEAYRSRGPPPKDRTVNLLSFTGGGEATTTYIAKALEYRRSGLPVDLELRHGIMIHDDGGRTRREKDALLSSDRYQTEVPAVGDIAASHSWATDHPAKRDVLFGYIFNPSKDTGPVASININDADITEEDIVWYLDVSRELAQKIIVLKRSHASLNEATLEQNLTKAEYLKVLACIHKDMFRFEGPGILERLEDIVTYYIKQVVERYAEDPDRDLPVDWPFFVAHQLHVASLVQRELFDSNILTLVATPESWQNLFTYGLWINEGFLNPKSVTSPAGLDANADLERLYEVSGIEGFKGIPVSVDAAAVLITVHEAFVVKVGDDEAIAIGRDEQNQMRFTRIKKREIASKKMFVATALETSRRDNIITPEPTVLDIGGRTLKIRLGADYDRKEVIIEIDGHILTVFEDLDYQAKTNARLVSADGTARDVDISTRAEWSDVGDIGISVKGRRVEEQTNITDASDPHLSPMKRVIFGRPAGETVEVLNINSPLITAEHISEYLGISLKDARKLIRARNRLSGRRFLTKDDLKGVLDDLGIEMAEAQLGRINLRGHAFKKVRYYRDAKPSEIPQMTETMRQYIKEASLIWLPGASIATSILAAVGMRGIAEEMALHEENPFVWVLKPYYDIENAGLNLEGQVKLYLDTLEGLSDGDLYTRRIRERFGSSPRRYAQGTVDREKEELAEKFAVQFGHIIIPRMPRYLQDVYEEEQKRRAEVYARYEEEGSFTSEERKRSKEAPTYLIETVPADATQFEKGTPERKNAEEHNKRVEENLAFLELLESKGVVIHYLDKEDDFIVHREKGEITAVSGKYEPSSLIKTLLNIEQAEHDARGTTVVFKIDKEYAAPESKETGDTERTIRGSSLYSSIIEALHKGIPVAIVSAYEISWLERHLLRDIPAHLRENLTIYASRAAQRYTFDAYGVYQEDREYSKAKSISPVLRMEIHNICEEAILESRQRYLESREQYRRDYPGFLIDHESGDLVESEIEVRGVREDGSVAEIVVTRVPSYWQYPERTRLKQTEDERSTVVDAIVAKLKERGLIQDKHYVIRAQGRTSINISARGVHGSMAIEDILKRSIGQSLEDVLDRTRVKREGADERVLLISSSSDPAISVTYEYIQNNSFNIETYFTEEDKALDIESAKRHTFVGMDKAISRVEKLLAGIDARVRANLTSRNARTNQILATLEEQNVRGQMDRLYGKSFEEADVADASKMAEVGFETKKDGTKVNRLGWTVENLKWLLARPEKIQQVIADARTIRSKYKYVIFCGMGGSGLSVQTVKTTFGEPEDFKMFSLRTTDPAVIKDILAEIAEDAGSLEEALRQTLVIPVSKSGTTQETISHRAYFAKLFAALYSPDTLKDVIDKLFETDDDKLTPQELELKQSLIAQFGSHMWVITDKGSPMDTGDYEQREIQLNGEGDIGGRFTAPSTHVFLLPLALVASERVQRVFDTAMAMNEISDINNDTFMVLAAYLYQMAAESGKDKLTFMVPEGLRDLPMWSEQLFEESLGKSGKGVSIFYGEDLSKASLKGVEENDRVFLRVNVGGKKTNDEFWTHLKESGYPVFEIDVDDIDSTGGIMLGFQRAVATIGYLWDICFVDQPAVEGYKNATREVMASAKPGETVQVPVEWRYASFNGLRLYYDRLIEAGVFRLGELETEVARLGSTMDDAPAVYAAIINILKAEPGFEAKELASYGRMTQGLRTALERARKAIFTDGLQMPSKLGEGPDKNHSFQQNIEDGKDMWFSTYFMPLEVEQPEALEYDDNLIRAQTIGTVNSITNRGRKAALITFDSTTSAAEGDVELFFSKVEEYLRGTASQAQATARDQFTRIITDVIDANGVFIFDVDNTLLVTKTAEDYSESLKDSPLRDDFLRILELGANVAIVTANTLEKQKQRLTEGIPDPQRYFPNMDIYSALGTQRHYYDKDSGEYVEDKEYRQYLISKGLIITDYEEVRNILEEVVMRYSAYLKPGSRLIVGERGLDEEDDSIGMLAFKPFISRKGEGDIRGKIIEEMKQALRQNGINPDGFEIKPGGSTTIDISKKGMTKAVPINYMLIKEGFERETRTVFAYFGDEWKPGTGNDASVIGLGDNVAKINVGAREKLTVADRQQIAIDNVLTLSEGDLEGAAATAVLLKEIVASVSLTKSSRRQQVDSMDQIIVVPAAQVIDNKEGFKEWMFNQPANNAVVIIAYDENEYEGVKEYENIAYIKLVGKDIKNEYNLKLLEMFALYGKENLFGGFELGAPASLDDYKSVASEIASGV